jgi:hypothetical protein
MGIEFEKRYLDPGEYSRCNVCERIVQTIVEDQQEWQYRKPVKQPEQKRTGIPRGLPREGDKDDKEFVFIQSDNLSNVLCRHCYHLHKTTVELK